jgi:hypothetical protein
MGSIRISGGEGKKNLYFAFMNAEDLKLIRLFLPEGILDFFNVSNVIVSDQGFNIYLEEKNVVPAEFKGQRLTSKGFMDEIKVQDFPIRGKAGYLIVKRRRWINQTTLSIVSRNWNYVAQGTRMTKEFADFLKVIARY